MNLKFWQKPAPAQVAFVLPQNDRDAILAVANGDNTQMVNAVAAHRSHLTTPEYRSSDFGKFMAEIDTSSTDLFLRAAYRAALLLNQKV